MSKYFGTDGVRGLANKEITCKLAYELGLATAAVLRKKGTVHSIVLGRDTRKSGTMLLSALAAGCCAAGIDVFDLGVVTTPCVAYLSKTMEGAFGAMVSASHNPFGDNGIKFFNDQGFKLSDELEEEIEQVLDHELDQLELPLGKDLGVIKPYPEGKEKYLKYLLSSMDLDLSGLKILVDCANGAAYELGPKALRMAGAQVIALNDMPTGVNINEGCGSTHLEALKEAVLKYGTDFGVAFDGDADRLLAVDGKGKEIDGDQILVILGTYRKAKSCVVSVMSNIGLHRAFEALNISVEVTAVGDRYILERMLEKDAPIGGEQSGHIILKELATTGDGILTALALSDVVKKSGKTLDELGDLMTRYPQVLVNARVARKEGWDKNPKILDKKAEIEEILKGTGRLLLRPSGTEPLIRVMLEGEDTAQLQKLAKELADIISEEMN